MSWYTIEEAARELKRATKTIHNTIYRHDLPRKLIRGRGRRYQRVTVISSATLERLRDLLWS
jgi:Helix-turn-helix domain